ncbi:MFS transporter [Bifidobacterium sp. SO4]|uniref:MFS transporter n=1 Tax=Bifidobacterium sp. SO4 TaxID=2809030 RepID=UPI001BDD3429|nr:MFS transporter [Bifidobacterium sp. SO4]MBT1170077.1 MFS transporter [Bifidobacterium sp. SO4]
MLSCIGYGLVINTPGLYFSTLAQELGITHAQVALPISIEYATAAVTSIFAGRLLSRFDSRVVLSLAVATCAAVFMLCSRFTAIWQFYVAFAFLGAGYAIAIYLAPSALLSNWFQARQGTVLGIALGLSGIGGAIFNPVVSTMITTWGWRRSYFITGMAVALLILPFSATFLTFRPDPAKGEQAYGASARQQASAPLRAGLSAKNAFRSRSFVLIILAAFMLQFNSGLIQHISGYEISQGMTLQQGATVVTGIMLGAAIGKVVIGMLLDGFRAYYVIAGYAAIGVTGWIGLLLAHTPTASVFFGVLGGIAQGLLLVSMPWLVRTCFGPRSYSLIFSRYAIFTSSASAIALTAHGAIYDMLGSYAPSLIVSALAYVLASIAACMAYHLRPIRIYTVTE